MHAKLESVKLTMAARRHGGAGKSGRYLKHDTAHLSFIHSVYESRWPLSSTTNAARRCARTSMHVMLPSAHSRALCAMPSLRVCTGNGVMSSELATVAIVTAEATLRDCAHAVIEPR